jgi:hypothetical protein
MEDRMTIRSYRSVLHIRRRIHRIDKYRIDGVFPGGVELRLLIYGASILVAVWVLSNLPVVGILVSSIPSTFRYATSAIVGAFLLNRVSVDGRDAHVFIGQFLLFELRKAWRNRERNTWNGKAAFQWDLSGTDLHPGRVKGPARLVFNRGVSFKERREGLVVERDDNKPSGPVVVGAKTSVEIKT